MRSPRMSKVTKSLKTVISQPASKISALYYIPESRIFFLRGLVTVSLIVTAAVVGTINYLTLTRNETSFAVSQYNSISVQALDIMVGSFSRMNQGTQVMAKAYRYAFPDLDMWPNVALSGFPDMAAGLGAVSSIDNVIFNPIMTPDQLPSFNAFAQSYWASEPYFSATLPMSPASVLGVWAADATGQPYPESTGEITTFPSNYSGIIESAIQMTFSADVPPVFLGFNAHNNPTFGQPLDKIMDCVAASASYAEAQTKCGFFSNIVTLPAPNPVEPNPVTNNLQAFIFQPILLEHNETGQAIMVGTLTGAINWKVLLSRAVPSYVSGLDCVVTTATTSFTYAMENGEPMFKGIGDLHDKDYSKYAQSINLLGESDISSFTTYQLTFYPRDQYFEVYESESPLWTTIGAICIILFCWCVFFAYDFSISRESSRKELVLDTKRRFVRFISHEIRTPLNTVRLGLKLLEMEIESMSKQVQSCSPGQLASLIKESLLSWMQLTDDILGNSDSAVDVLNDLLNYDKIEMGTLRLEFSSVAIWNLVKKTTAAFVMQAKQKGIELLLVGDCYVEGVSESVADVYDQLRVVGDSTRIAQVLRNLLSNALKFTPEQGKVIIKAEWVPTGLPGAEIVVPEDQAELLEHPRAGSIRVSVTDSGAGLSPQQLAAICSEGVQFNANQLQAGGGSGLGLFISKGLAEQHGGCLMVSSDGLGKGSTFRMELPLFRNEADITPFGSLRFKPTGSNSQLSGPTRSSGASGGAGGSGRGASGNKVVPVDDDCSVHSVQEFESPDLHRPRRILVVDDAASNRKLLMRILVAKGYICDGAEDGQQAVNLYTSLRQKGEIVDAVLMDFEMPVMDGPTATRALRDLGCNCFIVGVTGNLLPADIDHFKEKGANSVLAKPLNVEVFESMFQSFKAYPDTDTNLYTASTRVNNPSDKEIVTAKLHPLENV